jgi:biopolymer transport protein ExbB
METIKLMVDYGIIGFLLVLSIFSFALFFDKIRTYRNIELENFRHKRELEMELTRGLYLIASVASNAPYIGLLGTVLGIMVTFYEIGKVGLADTAKIMEGLALALKATAVGLLVAIPNTFLYNYLLRRAREILAKWEILKGEKENG